MENAIERFAKERLEFERRYLSEMAARKELHNQLITLKGKTRVHTRARAQTTFIRTAVASSSAHILIHYFSLLHKGNIRVFCRSRPVLDVATASSQVLSFDAHDTGIVGLNHKGNSNSFSFDRVFGPTTTQVIEAHHEGL